MPVSPEDVAMDAALSAARANRAIAGSIEALHGMLRQLQDRVLHLEATVVLLKERIAVAKSQ